MKALELIEKYYGDRTTERSKVPFINHIHEGLKILDHIKANHITKGAYCLHPMLQSDEAFNIYKYLIPEDLISEAILAMEYRRVANSYLSKGKCTDFVGFSCSEVKDMLIADKVQNYKDFLIFHRSTHERADELDEYFNNWFKLLDIDFHTIVKVIV